MFKPKNPTDLSIKSKRKPVLCLLCLLFLSPFNAMANFDFNANCLRAYQNIFDLKLNAARQIIATEKKIHPNNAIVPLLENYVDYFYLLTTESKSEFDRLKVNKSRRLDQIEEDDDGSPYYLYAQAEVNLQWALIRARFGEYFAAAREINKANSQLLENSKKFPAFHLNLKGLGLINAFLGNLPDGMLKNTLSMFGIRGNLHNGILMLNKLAETLPGSTDKAFFEEVIFYYSIVLTDLVRSPDAYQKIMKYTESIPDTSLLKSYMQAYVCSRTGHNDETISILSKRPTGAAYQSFAYLDLLMGTAKLNKLDDTAITWFNKFLQLNKGDSYLKDANLHIAWLHLLKGNTGGYNAFISKVKTAGATYQEKDKQALNEAMAPASNTDLLKARLLFDGGYFSRALALLPDNDAGKYPGSKDKTEFYYRKGRINDAQGNVEAALKNYQAAINTGKNLKYYYAANSALQMGRIYEKKGNKAKAKGYYNAAINMKDHDDKSSIDAQAKQGLKRIGN